MTLKIQNFGLIKEANIDLNKLNIILGINGSKKKQHQVKYYFIFKWYLK